MSNAISRLDALDSQRRRLVYERLWYELTIAGRALWSDPDLGDAQKLEGLKWLNEIQHRVWGAHQNPAGYAPRISLACCGLTLSKRPILLATCSDVWTKR